MKKTMTEVKKMVKEAYGCDLCDLGLVEVRTEQLTFGIANVYLNGDTCRDLCCMTYSVFNKEFELDQKLVNDVKKYEERLIKYLEKHNVKVRKVSQ